VGVLRRRLRYFRLPEPTGEWEGWVGRSDEGGGRGEVGRLNRSRSRWEKEEEVLEREEEEGESCWRKWKWKVERRKL